MATSTRLSQNVKSYLKRRNELKTFLDDVDGKVRSAKNEIDLLNKLIALSGVDGGAESEESYNSGSRNGNGNGDKRTHTDIILDVLRDDPVIWTIQELSDATEIGAASLRTVLTKLVNEKLIKRVNRGEYEITAKGMKVGKQ